jgi:Glycosyl transferase family 2
MHLSYIISSGNRPQALAETLAGVSAVTPLPADQWEIWVVDNAGLDTDIGLSNAQLIRSRAARPMAAANEALAQCTGKYIVHLNDDTSPASVRSVGRALTHLDSEPSVGAVVGKLVLADETQRMPALPSLVMPGATCLRKATLDRIGGFSRSFSGIAADYDLSFRITCDSFRIDHRDDIVFHGQSKSPSEEDSDPTAEIEQIGDRLAVLRRFLPDNLCQVYCEDWSMRWRAIHSRAGHGRAVRTALLAARLRSFREIWNSPEPAPAAAVEDILDLRKQARLVGDWARSRGVWRVVLAELSDNFWATYNACRSCGIQVRCVADDNPAFQNMDYRGLPIVHSHLAFEGGGIDGAIVVGSDPRRAEACARAIRRNFPGPILRLLDPHSAVAQKAVAA